MSKLIKKPIFIPNNVIIKIKNKEIIIEGKLGINKLSLNKNFSHINIVQKNNFLFISLNKKDIYKYKKFIKSLVGTFYSLLKNSIIGVDQGFSKKILLIGLGYKVIHSNNILELYVGYSHPIKYKYPININIECNNSNEILIKGINKQLVGQVSSIICNFHLPDIYKGKGIKYENQIINLKPIKKK